jgi:hypothetical protein
LLSQAGPAMVAATGATTTTTAARQLVRGRSRFRGEWEHIPCFFSRRAHALRSLVCRTRVHCFLVSWRAGRSSWRAEALGRETSMTSEWPHDLPSVSSTPPSVSATAAPKPPGGAYWGRGVGGAGAPQIGAALECIASSFHGELGALHGELSALGRETSECPHGERPSWRAAGKAGMELGLIGSSDGADASINT